MVKNAFAFLFATLIFLQVKAQNYCEVPGSFITSSSPESIDTFTVIVDTVVNFYDDPFLVKLKFARPVNDNLPFIKRPLIISLHGGGFVSDSLGSPFSTDGYLDEAEQMRTTVAPLGFIGASLDYRTGYGVFEEVSVALNIASPGAESCNLLTPHVIDAVGGAVYRATTDCRSAVDYIFRQSEDFPFVDTNQIYLFGASAGAITALHTVFSEPEEFYPSPDSVLESFAPKHRLAGIISYAGALADNNNGVSLNHMDADESVPLFLGHGTADQVVLPGSGPICNCTNLPEQYYMHGSSSIAEKACELDIPHELFLIQDEVHGLNGEAPVSAYFIIEILQFIKNRGICQQNLESVHNTFNQEGQLIHTENCLNMSLDESAGTIFKIYPNPATEVLSVKYQSKDKIKQLIISDFTGRTVRVSQAEEQIDISELPEGIYFITLITDKGLQRASFIKIQ